MRVFDHVAVVAVLDDARHPTQALCDRLRSVDCDPMLADIARPDDADPWRTALAAWPEALDRGVLFLAPCVADDSPVWQRHDRLVERLESRDWEIAFLGHADGAGRAIDDGSMPSTLQRSDSVPDRLCALALRGAGLQSLRDVMPERAVDGPLDASEWLAIAAWLGRDLKAPSRCWLAWPPLIRPAAAPVHA